MSLEEIETALDKEWEVESGFFSKLRGLGPVDIQHFETQEVHFLPMEADFFD